MKLKRTIAALLLAWMVMPFLEAQTMKPLLLTRAGARHDGVFIKQSVVLPNGTAVFTGAKSMVGEPWQYGFLAFMNPDGSLIKEFLLGEGEKGASCFNRLAREYGTTNVYAIAETHIWAGQFASQTPPDEDAVLMKLDERGNILWYKIFGGPHTEDYEHLFSLPNGNIVAIGKDYNSIMTHVKVMRRFNSQGDLISKVRLPFNQDDYLSHACLSNSGDIWLAIRNNSQTSDNKIIDPRARIVKINLQGQIVAEAYLSGSKSQQVKDLMETADGQLLVAVDAYCNDGDFDGIGHYVFSFDQDGEKRWRQFFPLKSGEIHGMKLASSPEGEIYCAINVADVVPEFPLPVKGMVNIWIAKLDADGNLIEKKRLDALGHFTECIAMEWFQGELRLSIEGQEKYPLTTYIPHDAWYCRVETF